MTWRISKRFGFAAAHHLPRLPEGHKCRRVHGHNYTVTLVLAGGLDSRGMVADYGELAPVRAWIGDRLDHRDLNGLLDCPTAELLAEFIYRRWCGEFPALAEVTVTETPDTTATYSP